jgi:hypothetical protein
MSAAGSAPSAMVITVRPLAIGEFRGVPARREGESATGCQASLVLICQPGAGCLGGVREVRSAREFRAARCGGGARDRPGRDGLAG